MSDHRLSMMELWEAQKQRRTIAQLEAEAHTAICVFCGTTMDKDLSVMLDHAEGCELRPENRLMRRIAELEVENERLKCCGNCGRDPAANDECDDCTVDDSRWSERSTP